MRDPDFLTHRMAPAVKQLIPGRLQTPAAAPLPRSLPDRRTYPAPAATGTGFAFDYVEFDSGSGVALPSNSSQDIPWSDSDIVDSSAGGARPSWLTYQFGSNLALDQGLYAVTVNGYIAANIGTERISMSVLHNTTTSTPSQPYETGITAGKGNHAQGSVGLMIAAQDPASPAHSFYIRFQSDTLGATRTCYASVSIIRLGNVT
jgi:hypothetical protein